MLQFDTDFVVRAIEAFPEFRRITHLLEASGSGLLFSPATGEAVAPILRDMLGAQGIRRVALCVALFDVLLHSAEPVKLVSEAYRADPARYTETRMS